MPTHALHFLGSEIPVMKPEDARFHILPVPWEKTVSYGSGTAQGPAAILEASQQLELWNGESEPAIESGIFTCDPIDCSGDELTIFEHIHAEITRSLLMGAIPVTLGGEHTVSYGPLKAIRDFYPTERIGIIHFDAHADLRDCYEGSKWSHACVMARAFELGFELFQIGTRALCREEFEFRKTHAITYLDGEEITDHVIDTLTLPAGFPEKVYVSFDVDGLDSAVMPATGTPVPGGLSWRQAMIALTRTLDGRQVVGMDVVELAPIPGLHFADFTTALLTYRMIGTAWKIQKEKLKKCQNP